MRTKELKKAKDQRPFQPFLTGMADLHDIPVQHPDAVAWDEGNARTAHCVPPGGHWVRVDVALITALAEAPRPTSRKKGRRRKG
jgi:hypothetical protein